MGQGNDIILFWGLGIDAWITIATVITIIGVMLFTKIRTDAVMLIAIGVLFAVGVLDAKEMCAGFSAGTVVVTGVLGVVMAGLRYTGVLQWIMKHVFGLPDRYSTALLRMMVPVAALSAFLSNTMLTMLFGNDVHVGCRQPVSFGIRTPDIAQGHHGRDEPRAER